MTTNSTVFSSKANDSRRERCNKSGADSHLFITWFIRAKKLERVCSRGRPNRLSFISTKKTRKKRGGGNSKTSTTLFFLIFYEPRKVVKAIKDYSLSFYKHFIILRFPCSYKNLLFRCLYRAIFCKQVTYLKIMTNSGN